MSASAGGMAPRPRGRGMAAEPLPDQRHRFEIPDDVCYLNNAYVSPQLRGVTEAGQRAVARKSRPWEITAADFFEELEVLRALFAAVCGGDADGVAVVPSVSYGVSLASANLPLRTGE
jgi:kynureninase